MFVYLKLANATNNIKVQNIHVHTKV